MTVTDIAPTLSIPIERRDRLSKSIAREHAIGGPKPSEVTLMASNDSVWRAVLATRPSALEAIGRKLAVTIDWRAILAGHDEAYRVGPKDVRPEAYCRDVGA